MTEITIDADLLFDAIGDRTKARDIKNCYHA